jgi:hypothetical protein
VKRTKSRNPTFLGLSITFHVFRERRLQHFLSFIPPNTLCSAYYAANLVFCLDDANNLLTNTVIGFDYAVFLQLFKFSG